MFGKEVSKTSERNNDTDDSANQIWGQFLFLFLFSCVSACSVNGQIDEKSARDVGMLTGGIAGYAIGGRSPEGKFIGTVIGVTLGGFIANGIAQSLNEEDRRIAHQRYAAALSRGKTGEAYFWANPLSGVSTRFVAQTPKTAEVRQRVVHASNVEAPPNLTIIGDLYRAIATSQLRAAPHDDAPVTGKIGVGQTITVFGRLYSEPWYFVGRDGIAAGYVRETSLRPVKGENQAATILAAAEKPEPPSEAFKTSELNGKTTCRDLEYQIELERKVAEQNRFTSCKTANGNWVVQ
jgi:surface antigen